MCLPATRCATFQARSPRDAARHSALQARSSGLSARCMALKARSSGLSGRRTACQARPAGVSALRAVLQARASVLQARRTPLGSPSLDIGPDARPLKSGLPGCVPQARGAGPCMGPTWRRPPGFRPSRPVLFLRMRRFGRDCPACVPAAWRFELRKQRPHCLHRGVLRRRRRNPGGGRRAGRHARSAPGRSTRPDPRTSAAQSGVSPHTSRPRSRTAAARPVARLRTRHPRAFSASRAQVASRC